MKHQKGFAPIVIIAIIAVVALASGTGYMLTQKKSNNGGSANRGGGLALNPNCKLNDPDLCRYMNQAASADFIKAGFSGKSTSIDSKGQKSESMWEMAGEEKFHFVTVKNGKEESNIITIDGVTYVKDYTDNKWLKYPAVQTSKEKSMSSFDEIRKRMKVDMKEIEDKTKYIKVGTEPCENLTCIKYKVTTEFAGETMEQYMYIDTKEYLLRKTKVDDKTGGLTETLLSYKPVTIIIPSPIKEINTGFGDLMNNVPTDKQDKTTQINNEKLQEELKKIMEQTDKNPSQNEGSVESGE